MHKAVIDTGKHWLSCISSIARAIAHEVRAAEMLACVTLSVGSYVGWLALLILALSCPSRSYAGDSRLVGVLVGDLANPFFRAIGKGVEDGAMKHGQRKTTVTVVSSGYDLTRQIRQIDTFVAAGYGMLIMNAVDSAKIADTVLRARLAGMTVVAVDTDADGAQATVTSDNTGAGKIACTYLAKRLGGQGRMVILNGPPISSIINRVQGCKTALAQFPGVKIISDDQNAGASLAGGLASMTSLLTTYPHVDAVFAINDPSAIGADLAGTQANRGEFFIVSVDGSPDGISTLQKAGSRLIATVAQDPRTMAERAVTIGYSLLQGKEAPKSPVRLPVSLITIDNAASYRGWQQ
jgi:ribose transport system substrate-binding protein